MKVPILGVVRVGDRLVVTHERISIRGLILRGIVTEVRAKGVIVKVGHG